MDVIKLGEFSVDSGCVIITDPCYIKEENLELFEQFEDIASEEFQLGLRLPKAQYDSAQVITNFGGDGIFDVMGVLSDAGEIGAIFIDFQGVIGDKLGKTIE